MNDRMQTGFRRWKACPQGEGLCQECRECKEWEEWECPPRDRVLELVHMRALAEQTRTLHPFTRLCSTERTCLLSLGLAACCLARFRLLSSCSLTLALCSFTDCYFHAYYFGAFSLHFPCIFLFGFYFHYFLCLIDFFLLVYYIVYFFSFVV